MRFGLLVIASLAVLLSSCGGDSGTDMGLDATTDGARDGGRDAGPDAPGCVDSDSDGHAATSCGGDDCDDADPLRYPGATEVCDAGGHDEDCDPSTLGPDADGDHAFSNACCNTQPGGALLCGDDCDDHAATINASGVESCNGRDDDCDGMVDEGVAMVFCFDTDGDAHGDLSTATSGCVIPLGATTICNDCDDTDPMRHPGALETCDGLDHDCNRATDDLCPCLPVGAARGCGEAVGACTVGTQTCMATGWEAMCAGAVLPVLETCNGVDDDCDGATDEGLTFAYYDDCDHDGYGDDATATWLCGTAGAPASACGLTAMIGGDCDDHDATRTPIAGCAAPMDAGVDMAMPTCAPPLLDCDGVAGCETQVYTDVANCGGCGLGCYKTPNSCRVGLCQRDFVSVASGTYDSCGIRGDGTIECWGDNSYEQFADGMIGTDHPLATVVGGMPPAAQIAIGYNHQCVRTRSGDLWCWGPNMFGVLGDPSGMNAPHKFHVPDFAGDVAQVEAADYVTCARTTDSRVACWGSNDFGSVGDGTMSPRTAPYFIPSLTDVVEIAVGESVSCALHADATVSCWGDNGYGEIGDGTFTQRTTPTPVTGLTGVTSIAAGPTFACAILAPAGEVWCWGDDYYGQLGDGPSADRSNVPVHAAGVVGAVELGLGRWSSCARLGTGELYCWGHNATGVFGNGSSSDSDMPVLSAFTGAVSLAAGDYHMCAQQADHSVWCWGGASNGQLGTGVFTDAHTAGLITDP